jgi:hypothetical protein
MDKAKTNPYLVVENKQSRQLHGCGFISFSRLKTIKVFKTISLLQLDLDGVQVLVTRPLKCKEPPSKGYRLFYTWAPEQVWHSQLELCETLA